MSKSRKFFTVLILGHERPLFRKLQVSYGFVASTLILAVGLLLGGLFSPHLLFRVQSQSVSLGQLEQENQRLWDERNKFEGALAEVEGQLSLVEDRAQRLARELGVEGLPSEKPAAGGQTNTASGLQRYWFDGEFRALQSRSENLEDSMGQLDDAFEVRARLLGATPNRMPVDGWFSHGYGWRKDPFTGQREFHEGLDIVADRGTEITASADGVVIRASRYGDYGKCVDLSHGFGFVTRYAHMHEVLVATGDRVSRGAVLGHVGSTGRSTGPHLHYEVFRNGRHVNPLKYVGRENG